MSEESLSTFSLILKSGNTSLLSQALSNQIEDEKDRKTIDRQASTKASKLILEINDRVKYIVQKELEGSPARITDMEIEIISLKITSNIIKKLGTGITEEQFIKIIDTQIKQNVKELIKNKTLKQK